jgi:Transposase DDE domain
VKAALDLDWDDPGARQQALTLILAPLTTVAHWLACQPAQAEGTFQVAPSLAVASQVQTQEIPLAPDGTPTWRQGGAADRRISVEDAELRHGRKSQSLRVDGSKRHGLRDLDSRLIVAVGVTPAHVPEASVTDAIETALAAQQSPLQALHIDRASRARKLVQQRADDLPLFCKAWPVRQGPYFSKSACHLDWARHVLQCPGGETMPFAPAEVGKLPAATGARCPLRERCTTSASGRSVTMHPEEALVQELRERQQTPQGRAKRRERVAVEHALAHVGRWQGRRARYRGVRKNVFDLRRCAVVHTLHVLLRLPQPAGQAA